MDHETLSLAIRWLHVAAMATAFGGAALIGWLTWRETPEPVLPIALRYEQLFWAAAGILVMTGIGNLGAFGPSLPSPASDWGRTFLTKLIIVGLLVALSLPRSLGVVLVASRGVARPSTLRALYGGSAVLLALIVGLAERLAHG